MASWGVKLLAGRSSRKVCSIHPIDDMTLVHKGKVEGDTISGTVANGDREEMKWTGKRFKKSIRPQPSLFSQPC